MLITTAYDGEMFQEWLYASKEVQGGTRGSKEVQGEVQGGRGCLVVPPDNFSFWTHNEDVTNLNENTMTFR